MVNLFAIVVAAIITCNEIAVAVEMTPSESYEHSATLRSETIKLYWNFNNTDIVFEVHGQTTGWVGVGFSSSGSMAGADIYIGWVKNGQPTVTDRYGIANAFPPKDPEQNIVILGGRESDGWTMFKFSRQLAVCEDIYDREITQDTQKLIFAWGDTDPTGEDVTPDNYHGTDRGSESMYLLESSEKMSQLPEGPTYKTMEFLVGDLMLPTKDTYYNCRIFKLPQLSKKHHIVKTEIVIQKGNEVNVHHMLLYGCGDMSKNESRIGINDECSSPNMEDSKTCGKLISGWAIGGGDVYLPMEAGFSLGEEGDPLYVQLLTHYDNPTVQSGIVDNSGIRITYTDSLRQYDMGIMRVGYVTREVDFIIPPGVEKYEITGHCSSECLRSGMEKEGHDTIKIFSLIFHTHLAGTAIRLRHFRDGTELPFVAEDSSYDFNYQESRYVHPPITVSKRDSFRTECIYNTQERNNVTVGGIGTSEEMCLTFLSYYPKMDIDKCFSAAPHEITWPQIGINLSEILQSPADNVNLTTMYYHNKSMLDHFNQISWTSEMVEHYTRISNVIHYENCVPADKTKTVTRVYNISEVTSPYVPPRKECRDNVDSTATPIQTTSKGDSSFCPNQAIFFSIFMLHLLQ